MKVDLLAVLAELQRRNQWRLTVKAFGTDRREPWYRHDLALHAEMITTLARCRFWDEIDAWPPICYRVTMGGSPRRIPREFLGSLGL
ncbi:unnamed protein product [Musa acuminata subsp. malaccensis]|uniref:(wild Malaysian banana) hypothetical protein n=1 Tax=Musa acuminata subsp. malaccensis TaxID=214687 RepID=A0A804JNR3_MUSAM|nr:unnamed protein product [Musa acuminata subsp. malaccensis]